VKIYQGMIFFNKQTIEEYLEPPYDREKKAEKAQYA